MGNAEVSNGFREKLGRDLTELQSALIKVSEAYNKYLNIYADSMQKLLIETKSYMDQSELMKLHQAKKTEVIAQL